MAVQSPPHEIIEDEKLGFLRRFWPLIILGAIILGAVAWSVLTPHKAAPRKAAVRMVEIVPPPPPPPPPPPTPPPTPPPPEEKPEFQPEERPEEKPPEAPPPDPAPSLGSNIVGEGDNAFGLTAGGGNGFGRGLGGNGSSRSKWGWYAGEVQSRVVQALRNHKLTRSAALSLQVRIWADSTGRIERATLSGSSGNAAIDKAIRDEILTGLQLQEPPPEGMPMPIVMRITAKRPN
ncbi:MAG: TonB C-terminal domain-containing protein [Terrimicrobiaceae bacterium]|nr:TonB C-terminal domain-containing protein [Terrimicrobiaceae bacterium]